MTDLPITRNQLKAIIPQNSESDEWYHALVDILPEYDIDTVPRIAAFLAQCAHESDDFRRLEENLNYSEEGLNRVFSRYFGRGAKKRDAADYARNPEKIANYVYMDEYRTMRGALGNTEDGDGWKFRGRGLKQLTGRKNYEKFGKSIGLSAEEAAEYLTTKKGAVESACWFWKSNKLNRYADKGDIVGLTKKINGGTIGLEDRIERYQNALDILNGKEVVTIPDRNLSVGDRGKDVEQLQEALNVHVDGIFGPSTKRAVKAFQRRHALLVDGVAGPVTFKKLFGV